MTKWTTADIPDQTGRTAVITGANTGLGYETAAALAAKGAHVVLAVRNFDKGKEAARRIEQATPGAQSRLQELDLTSLDSIRAAADELRVRLTTAIDLLINNAGVMLTPKSTTKDGFELQFGTNHLGHFAFTGLLLDRVLAAPGSRVVTVSSVGHRFARGIRFDDLQWERDYSRDRRIRTVQAGQPDVHLRTPAAAAGHEHHRRRRTPRRLEHRADPQPAAAVSPSRCHCSNRSSRAPTWARCRRCVRQPIPACSAASTSGPMDSANNGAIRRSWRPARRRTTPTRSAGCGRSPRS